MARRRLAATKLLNDFFASERTGGFVLISCTVASILVANSSVGSTYLQFWNRTLFDSSITHWINDGLMTLFFLLIGLELKQEFYQGQFSKIRNALLPVYAAIGGMLLPAICHLYFNYGTPTSGGAGIPMATDAAFALAALSLLGKRVPFALKILLIAIAVVDDLCAIIVIATFYSSGLSWFDLSLSMGIFAVLIALNKFGVKSLLPYIIGGSALWYFMLYSGIHATISGVLVALALPLSTGGVSPAMQIQQALHRRVAFFVLPLFALANTSIVIEGSFSESIATRNSIGIITGLIIGKPAGIFLFSLLAVKTGMGSLNDDLSWPHVFAIGLFAGIGFTISIFISLLAFDNPVIINESKMAVLTASVVAAVLAISVLAFITRGHREIQ